eukprot:1663216-Amphidinium_carterae.1
MIAQNPTKQWDLCCNKPKSRGLTGGLQFSHGGDDDDDDDNDDDDDDDDDDDYYYYEDDICWS